MVHSKTKSWTVIILTLVITVILGLQIPNLIIDNDVKNYVPHDTDDYRTLTEASDVFGSSRIIDVAIYTNEPSIITAENIKTIQLITSEIEKINGVNNVQSITNVDFLSSVDGGMEARSLVSDDFAGSDEQLASLKSNIIDWQEMYDKLFVSNDMKGTQIIVTIDEDCSQDAQDVIYNKLDDILQVTAEKDNNLELAMAGNPVIAHMSHEYMNTDLTTLIPLVILVVLLCLFFSFKNLEGTLLPMITVLISTILTVGLMALSKAHFTIVTSCLPVVLIAVGSAYGIHILNHYYEMIKSEQGTITKTTQQKIVKETIHKMIFPVVLAGVTTIVGFISNITSPVDPLRIFSIFSAIGVAISLLLSLTFIPSLLIIKSLKRENRAISKRNNKKIKNKNMPIVTNASMITKFKSQDGSLHDSMVAHLQGYLSGNKIRMTLLFLLIVGLSLLGISKLNIDSSLINYFPKDSKVRIDVDKIDSNFAGSNTFNFEIKGNNPGDLTNPEILKSMDDLSIYLTDKYPEIGKIISFSDFIKRMNQVMNTKNIEEVNDLQTSESGEEASSFFNDDNDNVTSFFDDEDENSNVVSSFFENESSTDIEEPSNASIGSSQMLDQVATTEELMVLFNNAFIMAGGNKDVSALEMLDALETELNFNGAAYNEIPYNPDKYPVNDMEGLQNLISQYLLLYSGSLDEFIDDPLQPSMAKMQIELTNHETKIVNKIINDANNYVSTYFPEGFTVKAYGTAELENALTDMITSSQILSLILAIFSVFIILTWYFRSPIAGIMGDIPLILSILINFGIMGLTGINLDMVTSIIGSISIGIGVDYTIHFMTDYHAQWQIYHESKQTTLCTLSIAGKAIVINALSVGLGFLVLAFSQFVVLRYIGILVAIVMFTSSVTSMTILPAMLNTFHPKFLDKDTAETRYNKKHNK